MISLKESILSSTGAGKEQYITSLFKKFRSATQNKKILDYATEIFTELGFDKELYTAVIIATDANEVNFYLKESNTLMFVLTNRDRKFTPGPQELFVLKYNYSDNRRADYGYFDWQKQKKTICSWFHNVIFANNGFLCAEIMIPM